MARQAVLLIHGVGEQRPMDSLREFVRAVWVTDRAVQRAGAGSAQYWSKPYTLSENYELRRLTTGDNRGGHRTDFFEFYWAHLMYGTRIGHVAAWAATLLLRSPARVPRELRSAYWVLWLLVVLAAAGAFAFAGLHAAGGPVLPAWASLVVTGVLLPVAYWIVRSIVGDAARYLHVAPTNVQRRQEIRRAGIRVLKSLHENGYDRIVVVGHSLGSVIGYDILSHAWASWYMEDTGAGTKNFEITHALEQLAAEAEDGTVAPVQEFRAAQAACLDELKMNGSRWRVTDFITLGSPLAHAPVLLARDAEELRERFVQREFPTCPPMLERSTAARQAVRRFTFTDSDGRTLLHQAAVFAPTRWTNIYFPAQGLVRGDLVGGPVAPAFGPAVLDIPVRTSARGGFLSHTLYWHDDGRANQHITALRWALDLAAPVV